MYRPCLSEEPSLSELVSDPIIALIMRTDGVTPQALWNVIRAARQRLDTPPPILRRRGID